MKKITIAVLAFALTLMSCTTERLATETLDSMKTTEMKNFDEAFRSLHNPENRATEEEKRSGSIELSDRRKQLLVPASIALIKSTGVTDAQIQSKTKGDITAIIVWATDINLQKLATINRNLNNKN